MELRKISQEELQEILDKHRLWLPKKPGGKQADLRNADLRLANLRQANLWDADLRGANLRAANLWDVDLHGANLYGADLCLADLRQANLWGADLRGAALRLANLWNADLWGADLYGADLRGAHLYNANLRGAKNLDTVIFNEKTSFFALQCPEKGSYIAYKKARSLIVELEIPADALRSSATTRKCRASKAKVLSITHPDGSPAGNQVASGCDPNFLYIVGGTVEVKDFDTDRWNECSTGIHHFLTRQEAVMYGC